MKTFLTIAISLIVSLANATTTYDTERGFRHPGGLHTEVDFVRVRQQLADGNQRVTAAYEALKASPYSSASAASYPVETIVRGGTGENYINAARGAAIAYQNALRWKIEGTVANARHAVDVLMAWARTTHTVTGNSDQCLAYGLYGYEFAQAAELMRDYEGWSADDREEFRQWMLTLWYPGSINFLRGRNGTWLNSGKWWQAPGHYWSNWGLCNALAVMSIGIFCDDVFIYNQGLSFIKYDQVGTFVDPRTANPILNDGLTEFWGNLVVTTVASDLETGAYGKLGQMNESGRDTGHAAMALGLAIDVAQQGWNQGNDLFAYMDHRIAAGIEYVAAQTQSVTGLPWTNYSYGTNGIYYTDSRCWTMTEPALGAQMRPYWGTVIGHYEGIKGVPMPFSEKAYAAMLSTAADWGGQGSTSGGYDHLGFSVLMNTRDVQLCPEEHRPTQLSPRLEYGGKVLDQSELGGLRNTYVVQSSLCLPLAKSVKLTPQLPEDEEDSGQWRWDTGQTTREITVTTDRSYIYRVTYTNARGVESELAYSLAVEGDCAPSQTRQSILVNDVVVGDSVVTIYHGTSVTLTCADAAGWWTDIRWDTGTHGESLTLANVSSSRTVTAVITSQGGRLETVTFRINVRNVRPDVVVNGTLLTDTTQVVASAASDITLQPYLPATLATGTTLQWSDGTTGASLTLANITTSQEPSVTITYPDGSQEVIRYIIYVADAANPIALPTGYYMLRHIPTDSFLTAHGRLQYVTFQGGSLTQPDAHQVWTISADGNARHSFVSLADGLGLSTLGLTNTSAPSGFSLLHAAGTTRYALHTGTTTSPKFWLPKADGTLNTNAGATLNDFPYELVAVTDLSGLNQPLTPLANAPHDIHDILGRRLSTPPTRGLYILDGHKRAVR